MFSFNIAICITFLLFTLGCNTQQRRKDRNTDLNEDQTKPLIVLFHGLGAQPSAFDRLKKSFEESFPTASVVALTSVTKEKTGCYSIKEQRNKCFTELSESIPNLQNRPTLLIGHSQGGLRAYSMFDQYKDLLNVKGIITLATPWEGAPIIDTLETLNGPETVSNLENEALYATCFKEELYRKYFTKDVTDDMEQLSTKMGQPNKWIEEELVGRLENVPVSNLFFIGCYDLKPRSEVLNSIQDALAKETIPILAIGGSQSDFKIFLPEESNDATNCHFEALNKAWTKIICGETDINQTDVDFRDKHDMIVPLHSQLAYGIPTKNNFKREIIEDAIHDQFLKGSSFEMSNSILCHPTMVIKAMEFAEDVFST